MTNPSHPAVKLRRWSFELGSITKGARVLGCSVSHLYRIIARETLPSPEIAARIQDRAGIPAEAWKRRTR